MLSEKVFRNFVAIVLAILLLSIFFYVIPKFVDINFFIKIDSTSIKKGTPLKVDYNIINSVRDEVSNINISVKLDDVVNKIILLPNVSNGKNIKGHYEINTSNVDIGDHTITTILSYERKEKKYSKRLDLYISIVE